MSVEMHLSGVQFHSLDRVRCFYLGLEHVEVILLFTINCPRCCAMAPFSSCSQALSHQVTTSLSLYCSAWKTAGEKMAPTPLPLKQDSPQPLLMVPLCNLSPKNPHQEGAPKVQSTFPLLKCFLLKRIFSITFNPHSKKTKKENKKRSTSRASKTTSGALFLPPGVPGKKNPL